MTPSLEQELVRRYPDIFKEVGGDPSQTCMAYGIAVGDGWFDLIDALCQELTSSFKSAQSWLDRLNSDPSSCSLKIAEYEQKVEEYRSQIPVAVQVKEKFGGLRFYVKNATKEQYAVIGFAENLSYKFCEQCGNKGKTYTLAWHKTLCHDHALKQYGQEALDKMLTKMVLPK